MGRRGPPAWRTSVFWSDRIVLTDVIVLHYKSGVIAGLDPATHHLTKEMDPRVKPAGDAEKCVITGFLNL